MRKILVTGGAGYVGSICASELIKRGHSVTVIDNLSTGHPDAIPEAADFQEIDIGDAQRVARVLAKNRFDVVFHFAAKALIPESVTNPGTFFDNNLAAGIVFLECLRKAGVRNFIFSSTAAVYGNPTRVPIQEDDPKNPVNAYGESKLALERVLQWYCSAYDWSVVAFRYFNACGSMEGHGERHDPETHIIPLLLQAATGRRPFFEIYGDDYPTPDGSCLRDYVHVLDIAEAHVAALKRFDIPGFRAFNLGTGRSHSVKEICRVVEQVTGKHLPLRVGPRRLGDPAVLCASPEAISSELGWKAVHSNLETIVQSAWAWERACCTSSPMHTRAATLVQQR